VNKVLVIYDSVFGNTEKIAQAIAAALGTQAMPVSQVDAEQLRGLDLLVVGSPTRGFRPTEDIAKLLNGLPKNHLAGVRVAAFDTRIALETIDSKALRFIVDKGGTPPAQLPKRWKRRAANWLRRARVSTSPASRGRSKTANSNGPRTGRAGWQ
jgi:flavodoxin